MGGRHPTAPQIRQTAPRPLPLHLMTHASTLMGSRAALPLLKSGSLPLKPSLAAELDGLRTSLEAGGAEAWAAFDGALAAEAHARHQAFLDGIEAYRRHPYHRRMAEPPVIWREGSTRLLDYRREGAEGLPGGGLPVLVVPSLINRFYILDLTARRSLMRYLAERGLAPFLVDWDAPGEAEYGFDLTDYVAGRLEAALDVVIRACGRPAALMGYCMGGLLALSLAQRRPDGVAALALLATPWDFHAGRQAQTMMIRAIAGPMLQMAEGMKAVPPDLLQAMFATLDPGLTARKFAAFARLKRQSAKARDFVALEDWANDGVALPTPVARQCLLGWYGENDTAQGRWLVAGAPVEPHALAMPTLAVLPERDRIVPPQSALPLAAAIRGCRTMLVRGGHVGMLLSARAKTDVYGPLAKWLVRSAVQ